MLSSESQANLAAFAKSVSIGAFSLHQYAFPVLECITSVARAVGRDIAPFASGIVTTCMHLIHEVCNVYDQFQGAENPDDLPEPPSKDFIVCALDVIGGVMEGLEQEFLSLALASEELQVIFVQQLLRCLCDNDSGGLLNRFEMISFGLDVKQSAFSLLGDLVSKCHSVSLLLTSTITSGLSGSTLPAREDTNTNFTSLPVDVPFSVVFIFQLCILNMSIEVAKIYPLVASNAIWSLGELIITLDTSIARIYGPTLANHVILLLQGVTAPSSSFAAAAAAWQDGTLITLKQNLSICLGRIAMMCPHEIADENHSMLLSKETLESWFRYD